MEQGHENELKDIMAGLVCHKGFKCYKSGFELLCKAKDVGLESHLQCLEERPFECKFACPFGRSYFCTCPLRVYIAKKLKN
jgi:hypothetical protein